MVDAARGPPTLAKADKPITESLHVLTPTKGALKPQFAEVLEVMRNAKTLAIVIVLGLGLIFSSRFVTAQEAQTGGLPALEDRVETLEGLVASALHRLSAEFQNSTTGVNEVSTAVAPTGTAAAPGTGGVAVYTKTLSIPFNVVYITFSAQGDTHGGAALSMSANIKAGGAASTSAKTVCQPMAGQTGVGGVFGGGGTAGPPGWMTLVKLPIDGGTETAANNCNDGAGGTADCHDNTIYFSCCALITPDTTSTTHTVEIRLGSQPNPLTPTTATLVFYERSTIYIDAQSNPAGNPLCKGVSTLPH